MKAVKADKLQASREWKKAHKERHAELARAYRKRNPEKIKAQNQLNYAIRMNRMQRQPCEVCGTNERVHAHHHDYSKPYDVKWLCFICHKTAHPVSDKDKEIKINDHSPARLGGADNPNASLTEQDVKEIRKLLETGISQEKIGKLYGVHQAAISRIKLGKGYVNVK